MRLFTGDFDYDLRQFNFEIDPSHLKPWECCVRCHKKLKKGEGIGAASEDELSFYVGLHCLGCLPERTFRNA